MPVYPIKTKKPHWLKAPLPAGANYALLADELKKASLATVCQEARCPNLGECWSKRTATIMILGDTCTRACRFCHIKTGNPHGQVNADEIENSSRLVGLMNLKYVVITSVNRDDLPDYGSEHFKAVVNRIKFDHPQTKVEVLVPDFLGLREPCETLASSKPFVVAQNLETVERLTHPVRDPRASYQQTLNALKLYKEIDSNLFTKSSLMVGLGETRDEIFKAMDDLRSAEVDILTLGQYLQPTERHLEVEKFYPPEEFLELKEQAISRGFRFVASGPLVRSSYRASDFLEFIETQPYAQ